MSSPPPILCQRILGNLRDLPPAAPGQAEDFLDLEWHELDRRALRKTTRLRRPITILLPASQFLRAGDMLVNDPTLRLSVTVLPTEVLVIRPANATEFATLALELGNLHAPTEIRDDEILVIPDGPVEAMLSLRGIEWTSGSRVFQPSRLYGPARVEFASNFKAVVRNGAN